MNKLVYTIGYSGYKPVEFIYELRQHKINVLIDVRSVPYSKYHSEYNKETLQAMLETQNIKYRNYSREYGARQTERKFYTDGKLDFEKFASSDAFLDGIKKVKSASNLGFTVALMCAEKEPEKCHRAILVARELRDNSFEIRHIVPGQSDFSQEALEQKLVQNYFTGIEQVSLFSQNENSEEELIREAYRKRAFEIAYGGFKQ
ncbi:MAG: DUF488 domain-containing protein [Ruminococcus sp.]|jgi:uncharacterized protein (DUF488 family)|nr:DUF488 domain-containing protein [Ruminococcus sp.]